MEDNHFKLIPPAQIISEVSTITLATISLWTVEELTRIGWLDNPIVDKLYRLGSTGVWVAYPTVAAGSVTIENYMNLINQMPTHPATYAAVDMSQPTYANAINMHHRIAIIGITTDGSGNAAAAAMITGPTGYYPICRLKTIHSNVAEATTQVLFTVTGGALVGPTRLDFNLAAYVTQEIGGAHGQLLYNLTDASVINIAINSGPISALVQIEMEYWYET